MSKNFYDTDKEKNIDSEVNNDSNRIAKDSEKGQVLGGQEYDAITQGSTWQDTDSSSQEKTACGEEESYCKENVTDEEYITSNGTKNEGECSCSYTPPYYVPNYTVNEGETKKSKKNKKTFGVGVVAAIALISVIVTIVGGCLGIIAIKGFDFFTGSLFQVGGSASENGSDLTVNVIKNDGSIKVNEEVGSTGYGTKSISEVVGLVADTVVEITTSHVKTDLFYGQYITSGAGSGVIIDSNGFIITNNHVIEGATDISVRLTDGKTYKAALIGGDEDYDVAILKIEASGLDAAVMGKSSDLVVGQEVVAIGNPLGSLGGTVTNGIISALDRKVVVDGHRMTLLQTNAAINPGNSGGGLFDRSGQLIGIVNSKQSDTGIEGLGFAIPIDVAWSAAKDIMELGYVAGKLVLGFDVVEHTEPFTMSSQNSFLRYNFPAGVYISDTTNESLAYYDRIVSMNGKEIKNISNYYTVIDTLKENDTLTIVVSRMKRNGNTETVTVDITVTGNRS